MLANPQNEPKLLSPLANACLFFMKAGQRDLYKTSIYYSINWLINAKEASIYLGYSL
jgi:hypothetical protein